MSHPCSGEVWRKFSNFRCSRPGTLEEGGKWWCKTHAPSLVKARNAARNAETDRKIERSYIKTRANTAEARLALAARAYFARWAGSDELPGGFPIDDLGEALFRAARDDQKARADLAEFDAEHPAP